MGEARPEKMKQVHPHTPWRGRSS